MVQMMYRLNAHTPMHDTHPQVTSQGVVLCQHILRLSILHLQPKLQQARGAEQKLHILFSRQACVWLYIPCFQVLCSPDDIIDFRVLQVEALSWGNAAAHGLMQQACIQGDHVTSTSSFPNQLDLDS